MKLKRVLKGGERKPQICCARRELGRDFFFAIARRITEMAEIRLRAAECKLSVFRWARK